MSAGRDMADMAQAVRALTEGFAQLNSTVRHLTNAVLELKETIEDFHLETRGRLTSLEARVTILNEGGRFSDAAPGNGQSTEEG